MDFKFKCDICEKTFDPDPLTMVETGVDMICDCGCSPVHNDTELPAELKKFASGAMCICLACQDETVEPDESNESSPES